MVYGGKGVKRSADGGKERPSFVKREAYLVSDQTHRSRIRPLACCRCSPPPKTTLPGLAEWKPSGIPSAAIV